VKATWPFVFATVSVMEYDIEQGPLVILNFATTIFNLTLSQLAVAHPLGEIAPKVAKDNGS